ncbi:MAG TPA: IPT/TIG domain-containing protein, partial [Polyangiaceae bacterium]
TGGTVATGGTVTTGGSVATAGSTATGGTSATTTAPPPSIVSVSPLSGIVTTTVIISGQNFGDAPGTSSVTVAGSAVTPTYWCNTSIEVPIPRSVYPGSANIAVTVGGKSSNAAAFDVLLPRTIYINKSARSPAVNAVAAFSLTSYGMFTQLQNSPFSTGDSGPNGGIDINTLALHRATRRLFALNDFSVSAFDIDPVTGQLTRTPNSPVSTGAAGGSGLTVNAAGTLVFAANLCRDTCRYADASISVFKVSATGVLTAVSGSPFEQAHGGGARNPALIRGDQLLVTTSDHDMPPFNDLVINSVDAATGIITPITGSPFGVGTHSWNARTDPTGTWYYMSDTVPQLTGYAFQNSGTPVLLAGMPIATGTTSALPNSMAISNDGSRLYMGSWDSNEVSVFSLNAGSATLVTNSPYTLDGLSKITALAVTRGNTHLVAADDNSKTLMVYPINSGIPNYLGQGGTFEDVGGVSGLLIAE